MPRTPRYDAAAAAARARVPDAVAPPRRAPNPAADTDADEFREISIHLIDPAPWQHRVVFDNLDALAASIEGTADAPGVGVLEPVLVRPTAHGRFQLVDGERRWRAAGQIARGRSTGDFMLPARVLDVTPGVAQIISLTANMHDAPKPIEFALAYARIRDILREELGEEAASTRVIACYGWHKKTPVSEYLRIADAITPIMAEATGASGDAIDYSVIGRWKKGALMMLADVADPAERTLALRARLKGSTTKGNQSTPGVAGAISPDERRTVIATQTPFAIKLRTPSEMMPPEAAQAVLANELCPAVLALVERGHGGPARAGYLLDAALDHTVLVIPTEVESLTLVQAQNLLSELTSLRKRLTRASRMRTASKRAVRQDAEAA
jgi:hypothetical protein